MFEFVLKTPDGPRLHTPDFSLCSAVTDIENSTLLWEWDAAVMGEAVEAHYTVRGPTATRARIVSHCVRTSPRVLLALLITYRCCEPCLDGTTGTRSAPTVTL